MTRLQVHQISEILSVYTHTNIDGSKATNMFPMELGLGSSQGATFSRQNPTHGAI